MRYLLLSNERFNEIGRDLEWNRSHIEWKCILFICGSWADFSMAAAIITSMQLAATSRTFCLWEYGMERDGWWVLTWDKDDEWLLMSSFVNCHIAGSDVAPLCAPGTHLWAEGGDVALLHHCCCVGACHACCWRCLAALCCCWCWPLRASANTNTRFGPYQQTAILQGFCSTSFWADSFQVIPGTILVEFEFCSKFRWNQLINLAGPSAKFDSSGIPGIAQIPPDSGRNQWRTINTSISVPCGGEVPSDPHAHRHWTIMWWRLRSYKHDVMKYLHMWQTLEHLSRTLNTSGWSRTSARMTYSSGEISPFLYNSNCSSTPWPNCKEVPETSNISSSPYCSAKSCQLCLCCCEAAILGVGCWACPWRWSCYFMHLQQVY